MHFCYYDLITKIHFCHFLALLQRQNIFRNQNLFLKVHKTVSKSICMCTETHTAKQRRQKLHAHKKTVWIDDKVKHHFTSLPFLIHIHKPWSENCVLCILLHFASAIVRYCNTGAVVNHRTFNLQESIDSFCCHWTCASAFSLNSRQERDGCKNPHSLFKRRFDALRLQVNAT